MNYHVAEGQMMSTNVYKLQRVTSLKKSDRHALFHKCMSALLPRMNTFSDAKVLDKRFHEFSDGHVSRKCFDIIIADERLRYWRRFLLHYLKHMMGMEKETFIIYSKHKNYTPEDNHSSNLAYDRREREGKSDSLKLSVDNKPCQFTGMISASTMYSLYENLESQESTASLLSLSSADVLQGVRFPKECENITLSPYMLYEEEVVHMSFDMERTYEDLCSMLRAHLGLPENIADLLFGQPHEDQGEQSIGQRYLEHVHPAYSTAAGQSSDSEFYKIGSACQKASSSVLSEQVAAVYGYGRIMTKPFFPLIVCYVYQNVVSRFFLRLWEIRTNKLYCLNDGCEWVMNDLRHYTVQTLEPQDIPYVLNRSLPALGGSAVEDSFIISGFYFTLYGSSCEICDPNLFSGPFITYLKRSDTYQSFTQRIAVITGDKDMMTKHRLAVVNRKKEAFFINKPTHSSGNGSADENSGGGDSWLWECFAKRYKPNCVEQQDFHRGITHKYAWLGIQRSTSDVVAESQNTFRSLRHKNQGGNSSGIKIV
eukprot:gene37625-45707_t